jgi:putative transcriptional regulator
MLELRPRSDGRSTVKVMIANRVREYRTALGMTQQELADAAGVSRQSIISIEGGRYVPSLPLALKLGQVFRCSTDELFQRKEMR